MDLYSIRRALSSGKSIYDLPLRVTHYSRVSTEKEQQKNSLKNQDTFYREKIFSVHNWVYVDGYTDNGITGTSTKKRNDFNQMVVDGLNGKFDLILTKEVCRFARNTLDTLQITRQLLSKGIGVVFELDNINTLETEGELRLTIMASLAQDESRRTSERTKFGFARSIEKGRVLGNNSIWGYKKDKCKLVVIEEEAHIVRRIYEIYSTNKVGIRKIGDELASEGIYAKEGKKFAYNTVKSILTNPKYKGFYCGGKTQTIDFLSKQRAYLDKSEWTEYKADENVVPAIVDEELWEQCNQILEKRSSKFKKECTCYINQYKYSKLIYCKHDGSIYWRGKWRESSGYDYWQCSKYKTKGLKGCTNCITVYTNELDLLIKDVFIDLQQNKPKFISTIVNKLNEITDTCKKEENEDIESLKNEIDSVKNEKKNLIKLYSMEKIDSNEFEEINNEYKVQIAELEKRLNYNKSIGQAEIRRENAKIFRKYFDYELDKNENVTEEFIREKINKIYVEKIGEYHIKVYICLRLGLELSESEKECICLGLTMCIEGAFALSFTPKREPCFTISGSSKISSSIEGETIPYPFAFTSSKAYAILSYSFLVEAKFVIVENKSPSFAISTPDISVKIL